MTIEVKRRKVRDGGMSYGKGRRRGDIRYPATWAVSVNGTVVGYYHGASSDGGSWSAPTVQANWQTTSDGVEAGLGYIVADGGWQQVRERIEKAVVPGDRSDVPQGPRTHTWRAESVLRAIPNVVPSDRRE